MDKRIDTLEDHFGAPGCDVCRGWEFSRVVSASDPAAAERALPPRPDRCPSCGRRIAKYDDVYIQPDRGDDETGIGASW
jgi:hypothetical protein